MLACSSLNVYTINATTSPLTRLYPGLRALPFPCVCTDDPFCALKPQDLGGSAANRGAAHAVVVTDDGGRAANHPKRWASLAHPKRYGGYGRP